MLNPEQLLDALLLQGKITAIQKESVLKAVKDTGGDPEIVLLKKKIVKEEDLYEAKSKLLQIPFYDLKSVIIDQSVLHEIPEEAAKLYKLLPLLKENKVFSMGMLDPEDIEAHEAAKFIALRKNLEPKIYLISRNGFEAGLKQYKNIKREVTSALKELEQELAEQRNIPMKGVTEEEISRIVEEAPITKVVAVILRHAAEGRASDIHIEPESDKVKVRFRVDGVLYTSLLLPQHVHQAIVSRVKILSNLKIDETRVPQDGRFRTTINGTEIDFRVSTLPLTNGEKVVLRVLDSSKGVIDLEKLGLDRHNLKVLETYLKKPFGMILITGPTGSGKTTTQYAMLRILNKEDVNIVSLEDPVEYYIPGINQSQVRPEIGYDFAQGLRHVLRQDPDVIMVGEVRDKETAGLVTHAALTGHIVLSTLHTNDAAGIIPRLLDMGVDSFLIPASLNVGIAQRLVRRLCQACKKKIVPPLAADKIIREVLAGIPEGFKKEYTISSEPVMWRAEGCKECSNKGMVGRVAIFEVMAMTPELEAIITTEPTEVRIKEETMRQEMITMKQDGILKVMDGLTSLEEVLKVVE